MVYKCSLDAMNQAIMKPLQGAIKTLCRLYCSLKLSWPAWTAEVACTCYAAISAACISSMSTSANLSRSLVDVNLSVRQSMRAVMCCNNNHICAGRYDLSLLHGSTEKSLNGVKEQWLHS